MRLLILIASPMLMATMAQPAVKARFFSELVQPNRKIQRVETTRIPYIVGKSCYRWVIRVAPNKVSNAYQERFSLPASAVVWGDAYGKPEKRTRVLPQRRVAITSVRPDAANGIITNAWCVAKGDPEGRYKIEVLDGARLLHRFDFDVLRVRKGR